MVVLRYYLRARKGAALGLRRDRRPGEGARGSRACGARCSIFQRLFEPFLTFGKRGGLVVVVEHGRFQQGSGQTQTELADADRRRADRREQELECRDVPATVTARGAQGEVAMPAGRCARRSRASRPRNAPSASQR